MAAGVRTRLRCKEPIQITEQEDLATSGGNSLYYATRPCGTSNEKARHELTFRSRSLELPQSRAVSV